MPIFASFCFTLVSNLESGIIYGSQFEVWDKLQNMKSKISTEMKVLREKI